MYGINEIFYSLQGEGVRAGTPNVFVRFTGCNMECRKEEGPKSPGGFDCDTEFASGRMLELDALLLEIRAAAPECRSVVLTGGEPALQYDAKLAEALHTAGYFVAIETNGSLAVAHRVDWVTVSPKVAEHAVRQRMADEVKYVREVGQAIPHPACKAKHYLISPAYNGEGLHPGTLAWCIKLVKENPTWRLSVQQHKTWHIR